MYFTLQPDLPARIAQGIPLTPYVRATFYTPETPVGYIDYPFATKNMGPITVA
jgi:NADPH2 dehydrogenase